MKKSLKIKKLVIVLAGILVLGVLILLALYAVRRDFLGRVPANPGFSIPLQAKLEEVVSKDLGGSDYVELAYDKSLDGQKWMVPCFSGIGTDDAADVCRGFARGYLRKYSTYRLSNGNIVGGKFQISQDTSYVADGKTVTIVYEDEKLRGDYSLLLNILEYDGPNEAKSACLFLIRDSSYETIQMDGVNILFKGWEEGDWAHYVLPTEKTVISIQGNRTAAKEAMSAVVEKYKKGVVSDKAIQSGVTISID